MLRKTITLLACILFFITIEKGSAQEITPEGLKTLHLMEDSLVRTTDSMYNAFIPDTRFFYHYQFLRQLKKALIVPNSYLYPFSTLEKKVNILYPEDKSFRIFNWEIAPTEQTRHYSGAIQLPSVDMKVFPLIDYASELGKFAEDSIVTTPKWYGCLYYRIVEKDNGEGGKAYTLLGLNAASAISNKKIMEPLTITDKGAIFGAPIFNVPSEINSKRQVSRFIIEYKKDVQASMNYDLELNAVFFDKLVSQINDPMRKYTYVPSGQYDGFRWENNHWNYVQDLIPIQILKNDESPHEAPLKKEKLKK